VSHTPTFGPEEDNLNSCCDLWNYNLSLNVHVMSEGRR